jgi:fumarylpyruvate hydrolase
MPHQPSYVFQVPDQPSVMVVGSSSRFAVHRIYCVGRNYADHAREMGGTGREAPFFFMKPADAIVPAEGNEPVRVPYPPLTSDLHHEVELVVAIGRGGRDITVDQALDHVWGYAVGLDMTRRDLQAAMKSGGKPWSIAKGFDASAPIGPITPKDQAGAIDNAGIALAVNGQTRQSSSTDHMSWSVAEIIAELSRAWTLAPGDLIYSGTPAGVGPVVVGDELLATIDGLPVLRALIA